MNYALRNRYPIENERQVKTAAAYFKKNLERFSPNDRVTAACNIEKRASELGVAVDENWVTNYSRALKVGADYSPDFNRSMEMRKQACVTHKVQVAIGDKKVNAAELVNGIIKSASELAPIATLEAVKEFDKVANLQHHYDTMIPDPYMTVFGGFTNPEYDAVKLAGSATNYDLIRASRDKDAMEKVAEVMGKGFAAGFAREPLRSIEKLGESEKIVIDEIVRGLKRGAGKGKGMPGGMRRNKNEGECAAGGPGKGQGGGQGKGMNRNG